MPLPLTLAQLAQQYEQRGLQLFDEEPDVSGLQEYARQRSKEGNSAGLNALAAQFAGKSFEPMQAHFLKQALAAQEPLKVGNSGYITSKGEFVRDPLARNDRRADSLLRTAMSIYNLDERQQRAADDRETRISIAGMRAASANNQEFGAGASPQIGSTSTGAPIFRNNRQGYLFTYGEDGQPSAYSGAVLPKATNSQPSEDERKAAGWFAQADNARRNMTKVTGIDLTASKPTWEETLVEKVPIVGEGLANMMRPENRQLFVQAASSMAEALLRAATGAGINESEARQKTLELVPALGDKPKNIEQKMAAYDVYMASLRSRAGRALPQLEAALQEIYSRQPAGGADETVTVLPPRGP